MANKDYSAIKHCALQTGFLLSPDKIIQPDLPATLASRDTPR
jgi:hypothetical protein